MPKRNNPRTGPKYEKKENENTGSYGRRSYNSEDQKDYTGRKTAKVQGQSSYSGRSYNSENKSGYSSYGASGAGDERSYNRSYRADNKSSAGRSYSRPEAGASKAPSKSFRKPAVKSYTSGDSKFEAREDTSSRKSSGAENDNPNLLIGRNPVSEAMKAGRPVDKILMQRDLEGSARIIAAKAKEAGITVQYVEKTVLDRLSFGRPHQGIAAYVAAHKYVGVEDILEAAKARHEDPLIVILDELEDPHNLGAILRSCDGAGAHGVIIPSRRSVSLTETVAKTSAGAIEYVPVARVGNLSRCIEMLKSKGLWIASVDMDGEDYSTARLSGPLALVIGGEGSGVSRIIREKSDFIVSIPMKGRVNSLNASNAAAIVLYEAARQRG